MKIRKEMKIENYKYLKQYNIYIIKGVRSDYIAVYLGSKNAFENNDYIDMLYFYRLVDIATVKKLSLSKLHDVLINIFNIKLKQSYLRNYEAIRNTYTKQYELYTCGDEIYSWNAEIELDSNKIESWYTKNRLVQTSLPKL